MCVLDLQCWEKTEAFVSGLNYFKQKFRAIVTVNFEGIHQYPCWIGPKTNGHGTGAILIGNANPPPSPQRTMYSVAEAVPVPCQGYTLYRFKYAEPGINEGYGEMRRYLWNQRDDTASIVILDIASLNKITPANISGQFANLGSFAVAEENNK
jgi:hypothetical protein